MKTLRLLTISFDSKISPWQIPSFRGAVSEIAGYQHDHFHNHNNVEGGMHYRYPLIQYKSDHNTPMIVCLNEGVEQMHHFFSKPDWTLDLNGERKSMSIDRLDVRKHQVQTWDQTFKYHLRNWLPLNSDNFRTWQKLEGILEKTAFLQLLLKNHLVSFSYGIGISHEKPIESKILELKEPRWQSFKGVKMLTFSLMFSTNLSIPDYVGLGKGASVGWGIVKQLGKNNQQSF